MLQIKELNKKFNETLVLQDISLNVKHGEIFGVIGKSGTGKSTLIRCVNLLEVPSGGHVIIDDIDLTTLSAKKLRQERRQIGMVFQHFNLLESRTAYENIALPLELIGENKRSIKQRVLSLLELVNLADRANHYPRQLSGGQKQRVAIARALITNPKLLLCDEPTSALDPESTDSILQLLKKINQKLNLTILLITHEMNIIKNLCDRVAILDGGYLIEEGSVVEIFTTPKSKITKALTQSALRFELPAYLRDNLHAEYKNGLNPIVQLTFVGSAANEPVIAALLKQFDVTASILQADLESIHGASVGFLICKLIGENDAIKNAISYLNNTNIKVEVIGYE
jgi:D-methionine transport system ATP-binding protein